MANYAGIPAAATALDTLTEWLNDKKPLFYERGLQALWSELYLMAQVTMAAYSGKVGDAGAGGVAPVLTSMALAADKTSRTGQYSMAGALIDPPTQFRTS